MSNATELLRRAIDLFEKHMDVNSSVHDRAVGETLEDICAYLATEKEAEPVGHRKVFICANCDCVYSDDPVSECDCAIGANVFSEAWIVTRPERARKPVTEEEIEEICLSSTRYCRASFELGVRYAEKHHGIGTEK